MVLYILTFTFLGSRREDKTLGRMVASIPRIQSALNLILVVKLHKLITFVNVV
jgi:hypothetical protein